MSTPAPTHWLLEAQVAWWSLLEYLAWGAAGLVALVALLLILTMPDDDDR